MKVAIIGCGSIHVIIKYTVAILLLFLPFCLAKPVHGDTKMVQSVVKFIDANLDCMGAITLLREKSIFFNYSTNLIMTFIPQTKCASGIFCSEVNLQKVFLNYQMVFRFQNMNVIIFSLRLKKMGWHNTP